MNCEKKHLTFLNLAYIKKNNSRDINNSFTLGGKTSNPIAELIPNFLLDK